MTAALTSCRMTHRYVLSLQILPCLVLLSSSSADHHPEVEGEIEETSRDKGGTQEADTDHAEVGVGIQVHCHKEAVQA